MKPYVKPELIYEDFQLSHTVANCNPAMNQSETDCKYESDELFGLINSDETVFNDGCTYSSDYFEEIFEDYCYQTGTADFNLFTS